MVVSMNEYPLRCETIPMFQKHAKSRYLRTYVAQVVVNKSLLKQTSTSLILLLLFGSLDSDVLSSNFHRTRTCFLRHMCELHLLALYKWDCPVGTCPLTFDRKKEAIRHAQRGKHHLSRKDCERYAKGKGKQRAMNVSKLRGLPTHRKGG